MSWLVPPHELTPDQQRAVRLDPDRHHAIIGGPGSGKTQVLLHRARYLRDVMGVQPDRFRIFVYTNVLKEYIKSALKDLALPEENVMTFAHWCNLFYQQHIGGRMPWDAEAKHPDFSAIQRAVIQKVSSGKVPLPILDFVLVDEGQDLEEGVFSFLNQASRHVTVCLDNKQQIYDNGSTEAGVLHKLGIRRRNVSFTDAFRVCPYVVETAAVFIPDAAEREAFRNQTRQPQTERQTPLVYFARHFTDEKQMLYDMVRERLLKNERIGILVPQNRIAFGLAKGLSEVGIEVEVPDQKGRKSLFPSHDFNSARPKIMAYHSAKGLTFDSVLMPRLVSGSFSRTRPEIVERLLFMAITRATKWCYFSTNLNSPLPLLVDRMTPLAERRIVTLLESKADVKTGGAGGDGDGDKDDDAHQDLDFL
jgi:superfamily I DNA/RNA helicase